MASLFFMAFATLMISCGGRSSNTTKQYSNESTHLSSTDYSEEEPNTDYSENNPNQSDEFIPQSSNDALLAQICNTKWSFTDYEGNKFILNIKGTDRDGDYARVEVVKNGVNIGYAEIRAWRILGYYTIGSINDEIYFKSGKSHRLYWDFRYNYLYSDADAFDFEEPAKRLPIKKIK